MASGSEGDVESELEREELSARTKQRRRHLGRSRHSSDDETGKEFVTLCIMIAFYLASNLAFRLAL